MSSEDTAKKAADEAAKKAADGAGDKDDAKVDPKIAELMKDPDAVASLLETKRKANAEAKTYRERLEKLEADQKARDAKALEDQGKFKELNEKLKAESAEKEAKFRGRLIQKALENEAIALGIVDRDAVALAKVDGVKVNDDLEVEGAKEAIEALKKEKPYLFESGDGKTIPAPGEAGKKPDLRGKVQGTTEGITPEQRLDVFFEKSSQRR